MLNISGLDQGIVIDHIQAGGAMKIYEYLNLEKMDCQVAIIKNAKSNKMGKKDIIKIEGPLDIDLNVLGVLDHNITINIIKNNKIVGKHTLELPETVTNIIKCKNPRCITSIEQELPHRFKLTDKKNRIYRCVYCESKFKGN
ncbi:MAG: aspartate carbamoyltransferase regulatory subunit [Lachnospiraceae bacterium]|nr:aspartate carbamoyltransferase regulatory subunit [Lachnospiraceae bacterium]MCI5587313.1 aspartate carbamoyltransferase regulatory subunit [Lachnospiraceae bacterium]